MNFNRWTIRSTEWPIKGIGSFRRRKRRWKDDIVEQPDRYGRGELKMEKVRGLWRRTTSRSGRTQPSLDWTLWDYKGIEGLCFRVISLFSWAYLSRVGTVWPGPNWLGFFLPACP